MSVPPKLIIYKSLVKPMRTYIQPSISGNSKKTNINKLQSFQNIALRKLPFASPYVNIILYR